MSIMETKFRELEACRHHVDEACTGVLEHGLIYLGTHRYQVMAVDLLKKPKLKREIVTENILILLKHRLFLYINKKKGKLLPIVRGSLGFGVLDTTKPSEGMNNRMQRMRKALPPPISSVLLVTLCS